MSDRRMTAVRVWPDWRMVTCRIMGWLAGMMVETGRINVALGKPARADSHKTVHSSAAYAVDGDLNTTDRRWVSSAGAGPHWLEIDLEGYYRVSRMNFWSGYRTYEKPPAGFVFQRRDGDGWADIFAETRNRDATYSHRFEPVTTDKVRLYVTQAPEDQIVRLFELAVYGELAWDYCSDGIVNLKDLAELGRSRPDRAEALEGLVKNWLVRSEAN